MIVVPGVVVFTGVVMFSWTVVSSSLKEVSSQAFVGAPVMEPSTERGKEMK